MNLSLTPGFSPVKFGGMTLSRFNGFLSASKPLKRFARFRMAITGLKPGVNGMQKAREVVERGLSDEKEHKRVFEL